MNGENGLSAKFRQTQPFSFDVSLECGNGELLCLVGPSGSGKSTVLRMLAGLLDSGEGLVKCNNQVWYDTVAGTNLATHKRRLGMVFQSYGLFPHLDVAQHIQIGLHGSSAHPQASEIEPILDLVNLHGFERRKPNELSGGQQQRLALARAPARKPDVLLLAEPCAAVDLITRRKLRRELVRIRASLNIPIVLVTHDLDEAFQLADRLSVIHQGRTLQSDTPAEVLHHPDRAEIARLMGITNIFDGVVLSHHPGDGLSRIKWLDYTLDCKLNTGLSEGDDIQWIVSGNRIILHQKRRPSRGEAENPVDGVIVEFNRLGDTVEIDMLPDGTEKNTLSFSLPLHVAERNHLGVGERIGVSLNADGIHLMPNTA